MGVGVHERLDLEDEAVPGACFDWLRFWVVGDGGCQKVR